MEVTPRVDELVLATYVADLKAAWREEVSDPDLINLLYDAVSLPTGLLNKKGDPIEISKGTASKIMHRSSGGNVHRLIRKNARDPRVLKSIEEYFEKNVLPELICGAERQLVHMLTLKIKNDIIIPDKDREKFLSLAKDVNLAPFLSETYLHTLLRDNVIQKKTGEVKQTEDEIEKVKKCPLPGDSPSSKIKKTEKRYISALMDVYGELTNKRNFKLDDLENYPEQQKHFTRQRKDYLLAEAIRRGIRDVYGDTDEESYDVFLDEIYNGIIDIWETPDWNGFDRLKEVLVAAVQTPVEQCWISRETAWFGNQQKKGACHVLVNEGKLEGWIR